MPLGLLPPANERAVPRVSLDAWWRPAFRKAFRRFLTNDLLNRKSTRVRAVSAAADVKRRVMVAHAFLTRAATALAQGVAFTVPPHPSLLLQLGHHELDEIAEACRRRDVDQV
jgi:hypothetical protein